MSSTPTGSPLQPHPSSSANGPGSLGADDPDEQNDAAFWKRRYHTLQESVNTLKSSKRKNG